MNELRTVVLVVAGLWLWTVTAQAQEPVRAEISYSATEGCPSLERFTDEVAARVGYVPFADGASRRLRVEIVHTGEQFLGTSEFVGAGARVFRSESCEQVVQDIASATAVMLDPRAQGPAPSEPSPPPREQQASPPPPPAEEPLGFPVRFTFETDDEDIEHVSIHRMTHSGAAVAYGQGGAAYGTAHYFEELCAMPCDIRLEAGTHRLGIAEGMSTAVPLEDVVRVDGPTDVHFTHEKASAVAYVGVALATVGLVAMVGSPLLLLVDASLEAVLGTLIAGGVGMTAGWIMVFAGGPDLEMDVRPLNR